MAEINTCLACGARLSIGCVYCLYCGHRTSIEVEHVRDFHELEHGRPMRCPDCEGQLNIRPLWPESGLSVAQCDNCRGKFFPPGLLEKFQLRTCKPAEKEDRAAAKKILSVTRRLKNRASNASCPVCEKPMPALPYTQVFPMLIQRCEEHGIWMDAARLNLMQKWREAGAYLAGPHASKRVSLLEFEFGLRRLVLWMFLGCLMIVAIVMRLDKFGSDEFAKYAGCGDAFDKSSPAGTAADFELHRARTIQACVLRDASKFSLSAEKLYQQALAALPNTPCRFLGVWTAATNNSRTVPADVRSALVAAHVSLRKDGSFVAESFIGDTETYLGYWGEYDGNLVWLRKKSDKPPEVDKISDFTATGFILTEQGGRKIVYRLERRQEGEAECR